MLKIKNKVFEKLLMSILISILIVGSASVYYTMYSHLIIVIISVILGLNVFINIMLTNFNGRIRCLIFWQIAIYIVSSLFLPICWKSIDLYYVYVVWILMPLLFLYILCLIKRKKIGVFINIFVEICVVLAIVSIIFWIFGSTLRILHPTGVTELKWGNSIRNVNTYFKIYFETQNAGLNFGNIHFGVKNNSIFAEAPICCFIFICANILNDTFVKKRKYRYVLVLMIMSTLTTMGQLYIILLFIYCLVEWYPKNEIFYKLRYLMIIILIILGSLLIVNMLQLKSSTLSGNDRITHIIAEWTYFKAKPIYGAGFDVFSNGTSNSIIALLADGGILLWMLYYFPVLCVIFGFGEINKPIRLNCILFMIVFSFTASQYTPVTLLIIDVLFLQNIYGGKYNDR